MSLYHDLKSMPIDVDQYLQSTQREMLHDVLVECRWNRTEAARRLGITFRSIRYRLHSLGLENNGAGNRKTPPGFSKAWPALKQAAYRVHGYQCKQCGAKQAEGAKLHVDHIKPLRYHPDLALDLSNLQILCEACNLAKGSR